MGIQSLNKVDRSTERVFNLGCLDCAHYNVLPCPPEDILCPKGSRIHLGSWRCYWLTEVASSWAEAQDSCRQMRGSDLASAESLELQHFIHSSFPV